MKQITIMIMSVAISVFILSGCNGKGDDKNADKEACDKKGAGWVWDVRNTECVAVATTKEACDKKGAGWVWDEANKKCNQVTAGLSDKEKCEAKGAGWTWNEDKATDAGEEYKKCTKDLSMDCTDPAKPLVNIDPVDGSFVRCVALHYTVINSTGRSINFGGINSMGTPFTSYLRACDTFSKERFDAYSSFRLETKARDSAEHLGPRTVIICQNGGEGGFNTPCPSEAGVYEVSAGRTGFVVTKVDKTIEELKEMGCFSHIIKAKGPL